MPYHLSSSAMRRSAYILFLLLLAGTASCDFSEMTFDYAGASGRLRDYEFGYMSKQSKLAQMMSIDPNVFTAFISEKRFEQISGSGLYEDDLPRNRTEFHDGEYKFTVKTVPTNASIDRITVTSSNEDIIKIVGVKDKDVTVTFGSLGDADLTVTVVSKGESYVKKFPLRVIAPVDVRFRITAFWLRKASTKIRMNTKSLPAGLPDLVYLTKDSVTVVGYCEWYDFRKYGRAPQVRRDTMRFRTHEFTARYKKGRYYLLRNITDSLKALEERFIPGNKIKPIYLDDAGNYHFSPVRYDTVDCDYHFRGEKVILDWLVVCDNPYIEFLLTVKSKKTFDQIAEGEEPPEDWSEESDDVGDGPIQVDGEEDDDDEPDREAEAYFTVVPHDFMTQHEKDSLMNVLNDFKKDVGYSESLSEEQKDEAISNINKNLDDGQKTNRAAGFRRTKTCIRL